MIVAGTVKKVSAWSSVCLSNWPNVYEFISETAEYMGPLSSHTYIVMFMDTIGDIYE